MAKKKSSSGKVSKVRIAILVLIVLIGLGAIFALLGSRVPDLLNGASLSGKLAASVNGQPITMKQVDDGYTRLSPQYQAILTKEDFLGQMIDQELLKQEALKRGITVTTEEADQNIQDFMMTSGMARADLDSVLKNNSMTYDQLVEVSKNQLLVDKLLAIEVYAKSNATTEQALEYYNNNTATFRIPEMVTLRHILIGSILNNKTTAQADAIAADLLKKATKDNFCELAVNYSDDLNSLPACGEYNFPRDNLPPEFESWAAKTKVGEFGLVTSEYGTHVLWMINKTPESIIKFADAQEQITVALTQENQKKRYTDFLAELRVGADVKNYLTGEDVEVAEEQQTQNVPVTTEATEEPVKTQVTEAPVVPAATQATVTISSSGAFMDCVAEKGAVLYGASWDSSTVQQKRLLGDDFSRITYVECAVAGDYKSQSAECKKANIQAYPTWKVGSQELLGVYAPKQLADAIGC